MVVLLRPFDEFSRKSCFEFRMGIEGESAAAAARSGSLRARHNIRDTMERLEDLSSHGGLGLDEDFEFHLSVAQASANDYFVSALKSLKDTIYDGMILARAATGLRGSEKLAAINSQHRTIYDAILARDEDRARRAMRSHLTRCRQSTTHWDTLSQGSSGC